MSFRGDVSQDVAWASPSRPHDHVVAVDQFRAAARAQQRLDVARGEAGDPGRVGGVVGHEAAADLAAPDVRDRHAIAAREAARDGRDAGREQTRSPPRAREPRPRSTVTVPRVIERAPDPGLAGTQRRLRRRERTCSARSCAMRRSGFAPGRPSAITMWVPPAVAILAASILVRMPPRESSEAAPPAMALRCSQVDARPRPGSGARRGFEAGGAV